jgi:ABC-type branched-subunit amino acid transport system ATPase component/ABC-type branched-subunit amino acid transport system permease subunit
MTVSTRRSVLIVAAVVAVVVVATQIDPHKVPMGAVLDGVIYGSLNGLLAIGLVLIYRVSRAINFAYGSMGALAASAGVSLYLGHHWPWGVVIVVALVLGGIVGAGVGALIEWRFSGSSRLILTVATIGLSQVLGGIAVYLPEWLHGPTSSAVGGFQTGLNHIHLEIRPVLFTGNELLIVIMVPVAVIAVSWVLLRTDAGRAVRAIADNSVRARLIGIPARRLLLGVWAMSGVVAALAVMLEAPSQGVVLNAAAGPTLLLAPLAAAVVARMERLGVAFVAAIGLGVLQDVVQLDASKQAVSTVIFLVVVVVALLVQHRTQSRSEAADESSWSAGQVLKPISAAFRNRREVRAVRWVGLLVLLTVALTLPALLTPGRLDQVSGAIVFGLAAVSLVVLSGWGGTVSLGQMAIVGVGAIAAGDLMMHFNLDLFFALGAGGFVGAVIALVLGLPALRVKGLYLAVTTLAFAVAADEFFFNSANFPSLLPSAVLRPVLWKRFNLGSEGDLYLVCLTSLVLAIVLTRGIRNARPGRVVLAARDNLRAAEAAAVPTVRARLTAFAISGFIAGVAGGLYVVIYGSVAGSASGSAFPSSASLVVFSMTVIGGLNSVGGALCGVALIQWLGIEFPKLQVLLTGAGLLVVLTVFPAGIAGVLHRLRDWALAMLARRQGIALSVWEQDSGNAEKAATLLLETDTEPGAAESLTESADTSDAEVLLRCTNVNAAYGSLQVLFGVNMTVHEGEILALLGTNGAGKSSLLKAVTGLLPANEGAVTFGQEHITKQSTEDIARMGLTMMPGGRGIFASLTVDENLRVASWPLRRDRVVAEAARNEVVALFPILGERSEATAGDLSGGEQQMLSLAMAFLVRPKLLCIDELSLGLSPVVVSALIEKVRDLNRLGTTIVLVEQSVSVALRVAERAIFLEKGQVRFSGRTDELVGRPDLLRSVFIGGTGSSDEVDEFELTVDIVEAPVVTDCPVRDVVSRPESEAIPVLEINGLVKRFGGITAVAGVDLAIQPREIVGLVGHNGAGKTTLFDLISGFLVPDGGRIVLDGTEITAMPPYERAIGGLGRSFQEARLFPTLSVTETITVALERHLANRDPFAAALQLPACTDSEAQAAARVEEIIDLLGLSDFRERPTGELSTGTRRIVELACILAHRPSLLLLDEPTGGVAQAETKALVPLLRRVATVTECAMIVIEHDMSMISDLTDRLIAFELGSIIADGSPNDVLSHPAVIASYLGADPVAT